MQQVFIWSQTHKLTLSNAPFTNPSSAVTRFPSTSRREYLLAISVFSEPA